MADDHSFRASQPPPPPPTSSPPPPNRSQDLQTYFGLGTVLSANSRFLMHQRFRLEIIGQLIFLLQGAIIILAMSTNSLTFVRKQPSVFFFFALIPALLYAGLMASIIRQYLGFIGGHNERAFAFCRFHQHLFNTPSRDDYISDGKKARSNLIIFCVFGSYISVALTLLMINIVVRAE